jgi:hypothetical protein
MLLLGLAGNPSASPEVLTRLTAANIDRSGLALRHDLSTDAAAALAVDGDVTVRSNLASNPTLPPALQVVLAGDADPRVRGRLAEGPVCYTPFGIQGSGSPDLLPRDVYDLLARDPEPKVRRALAFNWNLPNDVRTRMLDDADSRTAAIAAIEWPLAPTGRIAELQSRATGSFGRQLLLLHLDGPLPAETARAMLAEIDSAAGDADSEPFPTCLISAGVGVTDE